MRKAGIALIALAFVCVLEAQQPIVTDTASGKTPDRASQVVIIGSQPLTVSKAPVSGAFEPPTLTGPDEMIFKFDVAPVVEGQPHPNRTIVLVPPLGFSLNRDRFHFAAKDGVHGEVIIRRTQDAGRGRILTAAILSTESSSNPARRGDPISTTYFSFTYVPLVTLRLYFLLGVLGIAIGYFVRAAKKLLDSTQPAPHRVALAQAQAIRAAGADNVVPPSTPQTLFWKYWYLLDFGVTVILGIVVLITLMQNGLPPTTAGYPVNAFAIGFGIGLLTNTEIITKVTPR